jgi:hypothetical protein
MNTVGYQILQNCTHIVAKANNFTQDSLLLHSKEISALTLPGS